MTKTCKVITQPSSTGSTIKPLFTYNAEQLEKVELLRKYAASIALPETEPYYAWEQRWLNRKDTIYRYMRAGKWNLEESKRRIKATLEWRRDFQPDLIPPDEVKIEAETGKIVLNGFDRDGRPILYMRPGHENTQRSPRQIRHLVWWLERAVDIMPVDEGVDNMVILVDYKTTTLRTNPSVSVAAKVLSILQAHYPEHLGRALVVNLPWMLSFFYRGISPFLDPVTRDKMRFNPNLHELISQEQLDADFGGDYKLDFEKDQYWDQILELCKIAPDGTRTTADKVSSSPTAPEIVALDTKPSEQTLVADVPATLKSPTPAETPIVSSVAA